MASSVHARRDPGTNGTLGVTAMTFNIYNDSSSPPGDGGIGGWMGRRGLTVATIRDHLPDVIGLQEVYLWQVDFLLSELPQYACVRCARDADGTDEAVPIMYRRDRFELAESGHFWLSESPHTPGSKGGDAWGNMTTPRLVTWVRLRDTSNGACFYVYNTHLASDEDGGEASRTMSARLIAERIAHRTFPGDCFILMGDFNAGEDEFCVRYLTGRAPYAGPGCPTPPRLAPVRAIDAWRARRSEHGGTRCSNDAGADDGERFDYILIGDIEPRTGAAANRGRPRIVGVALAGNRPACASDHSALVATAEIPIAAQGAVGLRPAAEAADD